MEREGIPTGRAIATVSVWCPASGRHVRATQLALYTDGEREWWYCPGCGGKAFED